MSWIKLKCSNNILRGDVISYDTLLDIYTLANNMNSPIYVAMNDAEQDSENVGVYYVKAKIQGQIEAKAARDIIDQGGFIGVENGGVYVDNSMSSCGIIWNNFIGASARVAGDLVTVTLR